MRFDNIDGGEILKACKDHFEAFALQVYRYQYEHNDLYRRYHEALRIKPGAVSSLEEIPFLPISFFKTHIISSGAGKEPELVFDSSGTTGMIPSKHYVADRALYDTVALAGFEQFYGPVAGLTILALLPSYLERSGSSLVHMAQMLMDRSGQEHNGFYLNEWEALAEKLRSLVQEGRKVLLLGVTFALLDFAEQYPMDLEGVIVMETGGMKGRKEEWTRAQVHGFLKEKWNLAAVHSEYGMTELLSQAYAAADGIFTPIPSLRALVRDVQDPLDSSLQGSGALNIIDLANIHSCSFIATEDMAKVRPDGTFEVLGRMDFAALRGCSLMAP
ncbi:MAG: acyl transferase [Chitinophagaceae bacterium]|nr:acyl transferase [Chitinophagaceae bacterium]